METKYTPAMRPSIVSKRNNALIKLVRLLFFINSQMKVTVSPSPKINLMYSICHFLMSLTKISCSKSTEIGKFLLNCPRSWPNWPQRLCLRSGALPKLRPVHDTKTWNEDINFGLHVSAPLRKHFVGCWAFQSTVIS